MGNGVLSTLNSARITVDLNGQRVSMNARDLAGLFDGRGRTPRYEDSTAVVAVADARVVEHGGDADNAPVAQVVPGVQPDEQRGNFAALLRALVEQVNVQAPAVQENPPVQVHVGGGGAAGQVEDVSSFFGHVPSDELKSWAKKEYEHNPDNLRNIRRALERIVNEQLAKKGRIAFQAYGFAECPPLKGLGLPGGELNLSGNSLTALPDDFSTWFTGPIRKLDLRQNNMEYVPDVVQTLKDLECLNLGGNSFKELPDWLTRDTFPNLEELWLNDGTFGGLTPGVLGFVESGITVHIFNWLDNYNLNTEALGRAEDIGDAARLARQTAMGS